jgi:hypothetical protein
VLTFRRVRSTADNPVRQPDNPTAPPPCRHPQVTASPATLEPTPTPPQTPNATRLPVPPAPVGPRHPADTTPVPPRGVSPRQSPATRAPPRGCPEKKGAGGGRVRGTLPPQSPNFFNNLSIFFGRISTPSTPASCRRPPPEFDEVAEERSPVPPLLASKHHSGRFAALGGQFFRGPPRIGVSH